MKKIRTLSIMAMAITLAACNEKVSPELQDANVVTPPPTTVTQDTFTFKVTTTSNPALEYMLHKTGNTFKPDPILTSDDCEVRKSVETFKRAEFGKSQYDMVDPTDPDELETVNDITCYLEAEELGLYMEGMKLKVEASPGSCSYVRYKPFYYYNRMPGNSSATYKKITCGSDTDDTHVALEFAAADIQYGAPVATAGCNDYLIETYKASNGTTNTPVAIADRTTFLVDANTPGADFDEEREMCLFNYSNGDEEQCDVGEITVFDHLVAYNKAAAEADADDVAEPAAIASNTLIADYTDLVDGDGGGPDDGTATLVGAEIDAIKATAEYDTEYTAAFNAQLAATLGQFTTKTVSRRVVNCAGKISNCIGGAAKAHSSLNLPSVSSLINLEANNATTAYSQEYTYPGLNPTRASTFVYANYRREFANSNIAYPINLEDNSDYTDFASLAYQTAFDQGGLFAKIFEPRVLDRYVTNRSYSLAPSTSIIDSATWEAQVLVANKVASRPYAAEAFLGIGSFRGASNATNPYYTFECLDTAREMTARIRILVREWDRMIPDDTSSTEFISDISSGEIDAFQDNTHYNTFNTYEDEEYNDFYDWDDFLRFDRTTPGPVYTPVNGFFSTSSFPNEDINN